MVKRSSDKAETPGSSPGTSTIYVWDSSIGRASGCDPEGCEFDPRSHPHYAPVDELVESSPFHGGVCGFEARPVFHFYFTISYMFL